MGKHMARRLFVMAWRKRIFSSETGVPNSRKRLTAYSWQKKKKKKKSARVANPL